jgi:hypothetical protein
MQDNATVPRSPGRIGLLARMMTSWLPGARDRSSQRPMPTPEPSPGFKRLQKAALLGARAGLSGGFAVISAEAASYFVPPPYTWLVYAVTGGTMTVVAGQTLGLRITDRVFAADRRIFRNVGLVVK